MQVKIVQQIDSTWWDGLIRSAGGEFEQSTGCAAYFGSELYRCLPYYAIVEDHGIVVGLALFISQGYGQSALTMRLPLALSAFPVWCLQSCWNVCSLLYGPLILDPSREQEILACLMGELDRFSRHHKVFWWRQIIPPLRSPATIVTWDACFKRAGFQRDLWGTFLVDLTVDEATLWASLKQSARKVLKKMPPERITFAEITDETGFKKYYTMLQETRIRANLPMFGDFEALRRDFAACPNYRKFFLVEYDGIPLAGQGVTLFHQSMREIMIANSNYAVEHKLYGGDFLKFELFKWGKARGYTSYDLAGVNPHPTTQAEQNIRQFKEKWGGQYVEYPIYSKVYGTRRHAFLNRLKRMVKRKHV